VLQTLKRALSQLGLFSMRGELLSTILVIGSADELGQIGAVSAGFSLSRHLDSNILFGEIASFALHSL
jgi:hypothetical protein